MTATAVARKEVTLSHGKTRYLEAGSGHPVILLHGAGMQGGADDWRPAIGPLSSHFRVLAPDFIGWPPGDTRANLDAFPYLTDFVREFQDVLGLERSHVVGATMGGWIAGLLGYESPHRIDKLVMTGNPGFHGAPNERLANVQRPTEEQIRKAIERVATDLSESEREALIQEKLQKVSELGYTEAHAQMMKTMADSANRSRFILMRRLPHIKVPTLFILGRHDPSSELADKLVSLVPGSRAIVIEDGGHQVHYENTDEFCKAVIDFLT
ncbi:MAG TPA: alpha/beta hydrolase [Chloroflexota bacterium]